MQTEPISASTLGNPLEVSAESASILGEAFWNFVGHYGLKRKDQAVLLGINPQNRASLIHYQKSKSIPQDPDKFLRVGMLLGIHKNLRILYPQNRKIVYSWMNTPNSLFHDASPMGFIAQNPSDSLLRLATVRRALDLLRVSF